MRHENISRHIALYFALLFSPKAKKSRNMMCGSGGSAAPHFVANAVSSVKINRVSL